MKNVLFYKFIPIQDVKAARDRHYELCLSLGLLGKVVIAEEGLNGCLSGEEDKISEYIKQTTKDFGEIDFKLTEASTQDFRRLWVKIKPQIITTRHWNADIQNKGEYIEAEELKEMIDKGEDFVLLDARNKFEYNHGHFKNAIASNTRKFSEFPKLAEKIKEHKDKKIVTYCTGGIRCEKASAYLKEQGFEKVYQLRGGILTYGKKVGEAHWEGECFVFDKRELIGLK